MQPSPLAGDAEPDQQRESRCGGEAHPPPQQLSRCWRSEEHTSELQSPCNPVCRLLLEKKKITGALFALPPATPCSPLPSPCLSRRDKDRPPTDTRPAHPERVRLSTSNAEGSSSRKDLGS